MSAVYSSNGRELSFEDFIATGNFIRLKDLPAEIVAAQNAELQRQGFTPVRTDLSLADLPEEAAKESALVAHRILSRVRADMSERRTEAEASLKKLPQQLMRSTNRLNRLFDDYTNADRVLAVARTDVNDLMRELRDDAKDVSKLARKSGTLAQVITALEGRMERPVEAQYRAALERLYKKVSGDTEAGRRFFHILQRLGQLHVDWNSLDAAAAFVHASSEFRRRRFRSQTGTPSRESIRTA